MTASQDMLFDTEQLAREAVAATPWEGRCPLRYTTDFYTPAELDAALARWNAQYGNFGSYPFSHMWHPAIASKPLLLEHHQLHLYHADGRCNLHMYGTASPGRDQANHDHTQQPLPGSRMSQAICTSCRWHHIDPDESAAVEAWHDHAMPGWRSLPVMPNKIRVTRHGPHGTKKIAEWVQAHYPPHWLIDGAPILTERNPEGTRAVPGYSPLGGYDITAPAAKAT